MKKILIGIIIVLVIVLIYIKPNSVREGFGTANSYAIFPGMEIQDLKPPDYSYSFDWVDLSKIPITLENESNYNPDVKFMTGYGYLNEIPKTKNQISYNPMDASKLYEKKMSSI